MFELPPALVPFIDQILDDWNRVGLAISPTERRLIVTTIEAKWSLNPRLMAKINRHILKNLPLSDVPIWLPELDTYLSDLLKQAPSRNEQAMIAGLFTTIATLLIPLVYLDTLIQLRTFDDGLLEQVEWAFLFPLEVPRNAIEAERLYAAILTLPHVYHRFRVDGIQIIPQPFKAQMCFVLLFFRTADPKSDLWLVQHHALTTCPAYLLDYPHFTQVDYSSRPAFWMSSTVTDLTLQALLYERGSAELRRSIENWRIYWGQRSAAVTDLSADTPIRPAPNRRVSTDQQPLMQLLAELDTFLEQHAPDLYGQLRPGVTEDQIDRLNVLLAPLQLPDDVATLYRWHNGTANGMELFGDPDFLPLEEALAAYRDALLLGVEFTWCAVWFPIGQGNDTRYIPLADQPTDQTLVLLHFVQDPSMEREYSSITAMVRIWLAAYQTGVIAIDSVTGWWRCDQQQLELLRQRYDPQVNLPQGYDLYERDTWPAAWRPYGIGSE
ncbi:MAG: hypothetical protein LCH85_02325 [Chloroflexi bacterium]|nr:hypothetical protein [Chloroflexota bacterium]